MMDVFKKQILIQLGIVLGAIVLLISANQFLVFQLKKITAKIQSQREELLFQTRAADVLPALKSDFEKAQPLFSFLNSVLPPKDKLVNVGQELNNLAKNNKMDLQLNVNGEFSLRGQGTYANFVKFLKDLEKVKLFVKFNSLDINRLPRSDNFSFAATGQVFHQ